MHRLSLSWVECSGRDAHGGRLKDPSWEDVRIRLERVQTLEGSVTIDVLDGPEVGPTQLQLQSDGCNYLVTLGEIDDEDYHVRTFRNAVATRGHQIEIGSYLWSTANVIQDFDLVLKVFGDFFRDGEVSNELLK